jgi:serine/threonine protein kinase
MNDADLEGRLARWVEHHVLHGTELDPAAVCDDRPDLVEPLGALIAEYRRVSDRLDSTHAAVGVAAAPPPALPVFDGFHTIERLGAGGMGEVYKLRDLKLDRIVAAKVVRGDRRVAAGFAEFLTEARALALFSDPRIVQIHEFREQVTPPVLIMEFVDGFELGRIGPSLEYPQRARIVKDVCEALEHAHRLGVQHRDLKPSNIMLDAQLRTKILDFGLSSGDPTRGHFLGTPQYLAPEQLDAAMPIDARTDVYGLGGVLYELLCGAPPVDGDSVEACLDRIRSGRVRLPVEIDPRVPEPLQAIALKALEHQPADRYPSAREMSLDLQRYLDGRPVLAHPSQYATALSTRVKPHMDAIEDWRRLRLVYPHEAARLHAAYRDLERRDDDWIGESRVLSYSQIVLYLGAFLLMCGSLFYFTADQIEGMVPGVLEPTLVLGLPFIGLNLAAHRLGARGHRAVSVAFYLGGVSLLPLFLLILLHETRFLAAAAGTSGQLFTDGWASNRQLQVTVAAALAWSAWLALRTRTIALSTVFTLLALLFTLAVLSDFGLRAWFDGTRWDLLALHLSPLVLVYAGLGLGLERSGRPWFARPLYTGAGVMLIAVLEFLAIDGKLFYYLGGLPMQRFQRPDVSNTLLLDTVTAMSLNGIGFYLVGSAADRYGTGLMRRAAWLLFSVAPFATLEPLAYLSETDEYARAFDWFYLGLALTMALLSHRRQRKSFYYAGLVNTGVAFWFIADHYDWFDQPWWAIVLVIAGLIGLAVGFGLDARERRRERPGAEAPRPS